MKILDFLICDDVREEVNSKITLVGTYVDKMVFGFSKEKPIEWPVKTRASGYIKFMLDSENEADELNFKFIDGKDKRLHHQQSISLVEEHMSAKTPGLYIVRFSTIELYEESTIELLAEVLLDKKVIAEVKSDSVYRVEAREVKARA